VAWVDRAAWVADRVCIGGIAKIATVTFTSADRVRDVVHNNKHTQDERLPVVAK
jgi:hypothetical protein